MIQTLIILMFSAVLLQSCSSSSVSSEDAKIQDENKMVFETNYKTLKILDLDQMSDLLNDKVSDYKRNSRVQALKEGVLIAYSRPDEDVVLDKVISIVRGPLEDLGEWETTIQQIVSNAAFTMRSDSSATPNDQVTASIVLENILSDFKPSFVKQYESSGFETRIIEKIAASDLHYSKKAMQEKQLNQMRSGLTPSQLAQRLIDMKNKKLKADKEKKE